MGAPWCTDITHPDISPWGRTFPPIEIRLGLGLVTLGLVLGLAKVRVIT